MIDHNACSHLASPCQFCGTRDPNHAPITCEHRHNAPDSCPWLAGERHHEDYRSCIAADYANMTRAIADAEGLDWHDFEPGDLCPHLYMETTGPCGERYPLSIDFLTDEIGGPCDSRALADWLAHYGRTPLHIALYRDYMARDERIAPSAMASTATLYRAERLACEAMLAACEAWHAHDAAQALAEHTRTAQTGPINPASYSPQALLSMATELRTAIRYAETYAAPASMLAEMSTDAALCEHALERACCTDACEAWPACGESCAEREDEGHDGYGSPDDMLSTLHADLSEWEHAARAGDQAGMQRTHEAATFCLACLAHRARYMLADTGRGLES